MARGTRHAADDSGHQRHLSEDSPITVDCNQSRYLLWALFWRIRLVGSSEQTQVGVAIHCDVPLCSHLEPWPQTIEICSDYSAELVTSHTRPRETSSGDADLASVWTATGPVTGCHRLRLRLKDADLV